MESSPSSRKLTQRDRQLVYVSLSVGISLHMVSWCRGACFAYVELKHMAVGTDICVLKHARRGIDSEEDSLIQVAGKGPYAHALNTALNRAF